MGSEESVTLVNNSAAIRRQARVGKLDLTYIPENMTTSGREEISQFLTNLWIYEVVLQPAEWVLIFQTDSGFCPTSGEALLTVIGILCANAAGSLDDWLRYDWVGAPWDVNRRFGGNGGLSLRRVSSIITILRHPQRLNNSEPEDVWLTERLGHLPNSQVANGTESLAFSAESIWVDYPLGYHTGGSGSTLASAIWGTGDLRRHVWEYCPEVKITLGMDIASFMPDLCDVQW